MSFAPGRSLAVRLLAKIVAMESFDAGYVADQLAVLSHRLDSFIAAEEPMPLDCQQRLATFVIDQVPAFARIGHQLQAQVCAAMRYESHQTETSLSAPRRVWPTARHHR